MKVWENIKAWKNEIYATAHADSSSEWKFEDELKRVITELIPLRGNQALTRRYYENTLRYTTHANEHYRLMHDRELNGIKVDSYEYVPIPGECVLPEELLHPALLQIIKDDKYSFGYLYWILGSEYNRQVGHAYYDDLVIPDEIINYAIKFDFDETKEKGESIESLLDRKSFYLIQKTESALVLNEQNDARLSALKSSYESKLDVLCNLVEEQIKITASKSHAPVFSRAKRCINTVESIGREEHLQEINEDDYVVAYDFDNCPYNVAMEPFNINLASYRVVKTVKGVEDNDGIMIDLMVNLTNALVQADQDQAKNIFSSTRDLLRTLFNNFVQRVVHISNGEFETILKECKYWCMHTIRLIHSAYERFSIPTDLKLIRCEDGEIAYMASSKNLLFYRYEMSEYCFQLFHTTIKNIQSHPYAAVYNTIPFTYDTLKYFSIRRQIEHKTILTKEERTYAEFLPNCGGFKKNLSSQLRHLDRFAGKGEVFSMQKEALCDSYVRMADDYLKNLAMDGVKDYPSLNYAIMLWCWFVRGIVDVVLDYEVGLLELRKDHDETLEQETKYSLVRQIREYNSVRSLIKQRLVPIQKDFFEKHRPNETLTITTTQKTINSQEGFKIQEALGGQKQDIDIEKTPHYPSGHAEINVAIIHKYTVDRLRSNLSISDFEYAIKYADFSKLMEDAEKKRAKDYPLVIITKLKQLFDKEWYDECCASVGKTPTRVSGYHREGKVGTYSLHFPVNLTK